MKNKFLIVIILISIIGITFALSNQLRAANNDGSGTSSVNIFVTHKAKMKAQGNVKLIYDHPDLQMSLIYFDVKEIVTPKINGSTAV